MSRKILTPKELAIKVENEQKEQYSGLRREIWDEIDEVLYYATDIGEISGYVLYDKVEGLPNWLRKSISDELALYGWELKKLEVEETELLGKHYVFSITPLKKD